MTLTFPLTSAGPGPTSAALKFYIFSAEIAIPLRLMLIPVFHPGCHAIIVMFQHESIVHGVATSLCSLCIVSLCLHTTYYLAG